MRGVRRIEGKSVNVIDWLLDSDSSIRWQVMRDLTDAPADEAAAERARVATEGWGARLLGLQDADGDGGPSPRTGVPPRAPALPAAIDWRGDRAGSQGRRHVDAFRLPDVVALRCAAGA